VVFTSIEDAADLGLDEQRQHMHRKGVAEHVRRNMQVEAAGPTPGVPTQKSRLPGCRPHWRPVVSQPKGCRFGGHAICTDENKARTLPRTHDIEAATT
jgi:hypothetical protein